MIAARVLIEGMTVGNVVGWLVVLALAIGVGLWLSR